MSEDKHNPIAGGQKCTFVWVNLKTDGVSKMRVGGEWSLVDQEPEFEPVSTLYFQRAASPVLYISVDNKPRIPRGPLSVFVFCEGKSYIAEYCYRERAPKGQIAFKLLSLDGTLSGAWHEA